MIPFFDDLKPMKCDRGNFLVYKLLNTDQRYAFGDIGIRFMSRIKGLTRPQSFHLVFKLVEWYEKRNPP